MPSSFEIQMGLAIVGYPAVAAGAGVLAARIAKPNSQRRQAALAAAATAGLVTSHIALANMPQWPPVDSIGWIPITTALVGVVAIVLALLGGKRLVVVPATAIAAAAALYLAGKPTFARSMGQFVPLAIGALIIVGSSVAGAARVGRKAYPLASWLTMLITAAIAGLCALWTPSALMAMLLGSMATTAGALGIGGLVLRINEPAPLAQGVFLSHLGATLTYTHLYAKLPTLPLLLLGAAVALPTLVAFIPGDTTKQRWLRSVAAVTIAASCAGAAALIMHGKIASKKSDPANMYGG
ncbi:MAG: hypothetical protein KBG15_08145 [Kofleriaceae bacterium]|nr:hypothetical protein [Kofleriaceae bacterium]